MHEIIVVRVETGAKNGILGEYYGWRGENPPEPQFVKPVFTRIDGQINFVWYENPLGPDSKDNFMIVWRGFLRVDDPGTYIFYLETDDGAILEINNNVLINAWHDQPPTVYHSRPVKIEQGYHRIKVVYYNKGPFGLIRLGWITPRGGSGIIPEDKYVCVRSNNIILRGLPENYRVELWSGKKISEARVEKGRAVLVLGYELMPLAGYFRIYDEKESMIGETVVIRDIWGGDEYEITLK